jgi:hypothetical protein
MNYRTLTITFSEHSAQGANISTSAGIGFQLSNDWLLKKGVEPSSLQVGTQISICGTLGNEDAALACADPLQDLKLV